MADQPILKPDLNVVADRLLAVHTQVQAIRDVIRDTARQLDPSGKPTAAARKARNQLRNPEGNTTRLSSVVKSMLGPDGAAKQVKLLEEKSEALAKLNQAAFDVIQSDAALYAFETLSQIYKQEDTEHPSRKRGKDDLCLSAELIRFAQRLIERRAPIYILDQFTEGEMDMFGAMIAEKAAAAKHGVGTVWGRAFEGGFLEVAMEDITEDQRAAILSARGRIDKDAGAIYRALCEATGRKLDISPTFAASVFTLMSDEDLGSGESKNLRTAAAAQLQADAQRVMELLGLGEEERLRALDILDPIRVKRMEQEAKRLAEWEEEEKELTQLAKCYEPFVAAALDDVFEEERKWERNLVDAASDDSYDGDRIYKKIITLRETGQMPEFLTGYPDIIWQVMGQRFLSDSERRRQLQIAEYARDLLEDQTFRDQMRRRGKIVPEPDAVSTTEPPRVAGIPHPIRPAEHPAIGALSNIGSGEDHIRSGSPANQPPSSDGMQGVSSAEFPDQVGRRLSREVADETVVPAFAPGHHADGQKTALAGGLPLQERSGADSRSLSDTSRRTDSVTLQQILGDRGRAPPRKADLPFHRLTLAGAIRIGEEFWTWDRPELNSYFVGTTAWGGLTGETIMREIRALKDRGEATQEQIALLAGSGSDYGRQYLKNRRRELAETFVERLLDADSEAWEFAKAFPHFWLS